MSRETETVEDVRTIWLKMLDDGLGQCEYWGFPYDEHEDTPCDTCEHGTTASEDRRGCWEHILYDIIDRVADAVRRECAVGTCENISDMNLWKFQCSACYAYSDYWFGLSDVPKIPSYCPNCGRKVEG